MTTTAVLVSAPALAQQAPAAEGQGEDIVVLGTREQGYRATVALQTNKSDTPIKETPFSVQVVTRELIRDRGITSVGEALGYVPGFSPQVGFGASNDRFYIRGFITPYNLKNGMRRSAYTSTATTFCNHLLPLHGQHSRSMSLLCHLKTPNSSGPRLGGSAPKPGL